MEKKGHSEAAEAQYMPSVHHWWVAQSKQTRQTYRQSIQSTRRQFTKRWKRITRPRQHVTKELRNIRVKLNWEEYMWSLFIKTVNKYSVHPACYMSLQSCMWGAKTNALIHIHICWGDIYGCIYIHLYTHTHTHTHTHTAKYSFNILARYLLFYTYCAYFQTKLYIYTWHICTQYLNIQVHI